MDEHKEQGHREASHSTADYAKYAPPKKHRKKRVPRLPSFNWRKPAKYLLILLILAAVTAAAYQFVLKPKSDNKANNQANMTQENQLQASQIATVTKHYASQELALEFDYPTDWKVTETPGTGRLSAVSPNIQLTDQDGKKVTGKITLTIRNKSQALAEFEDGDGHAVRASEKVAYTKPSQNQRGETYISLLRWASSTGVGGDFDGIYITGNNGYQKDQAAPKADFAAVDPVVNVTFSKDGAPLTVSDNIWDNPSYSKPIKDMLLSLTIN